MNVKNKSTNEIETRTCDCGSWIQHWRKYSRQSATICRAEGCNRKDLIGAKVVKDIRYDNRIYIVPFCQKHTTVKGSIQLVPITVLVPAKVGGICGNNLNPIPLVKTKQ